MRISGVALLVTLSAVPALAGLAEPTTVVCRHAKLLRSQGAPRPTVRPTLAVATPSGVDEPLTLGRPRTVCLPAVTAGDAPPLTSAWVGWDVRRKRGATVPGDRSGSAVALDTSLLGRVDARLAALTRVLVDASAAAGTGGAPPLPVGTDELVCHGLRMRGGAPPRMRLMTAFGAHQLRVDRPRRYCDRATNRGWLCYRARPERGTSSPRGNAVSLDTPFGAATVRLGPVAEVCELATNTLVPPEYTVRVEPATQTIEYLQTADARAFADYPDGRTEEITDRVAWSAGDPTIAHVVEEPPVPNRFLGRNPGTTTLIATDPDSGARGEASLTVEWTLQSIAISPAQVNRVVGQSLSFTAMGTFASGAVLNVTQRVTWSTVDPAIATAAPPGAPSRSRITAVAFGTTAVRACDPITGICSTDNDGDATFVVQGGLQYIELRPETERSVLPGQGIRFTAIAHYADGREQNFTQRAAWRSTDPAVATAPNADGDRSRIVGVAPGITTIVAKDPVTGIESFPRTLFVLGDLHRIEVYPYDSNGDAVRAPGSRRFTAIGQYVGGGHKNLTQEVTWHSRDPEIGVAPNTPGDRSRIESVGAAGQARIWAEDPATGIASDDAVFRVLGDLVSLTIFIPRRGFPPYNRVPVGAELRLFVYGRFSTGEQLNMDRFFPGSYSIVSSDQSLGEIVDDPQAVRGIAQGVVQLRAIDHASGFEGEPLEVLVQGALERLIVHRSAATALAGSPTSVQLFGEYPPGLRLPFVGDVDVSISDESVLEVTGRHRDALRLRALAPGVATISVTDPVTGVSSSDSGDDATLTVLPGGPPLSVAVTPPVTTLPVDGEDELTAVATFPGGITLNVTQQAHWASSAPNVADVVGPQWSNASRVTGRSAGVATITATYGGVSSTTSGQDGIAVVSDVLSLTVLGTDAPLAVGASRSLRATALLANGRILNVTKMLEYRSLDTGVADFFDPVDPTIVTGVVAGEVDLDVGLPNSAVRTTVRLTISDDSVTTTTSTPTTSTTTTTVAVQPLRLEPSSSTVDFGQTARFRAMRGTVDVSDTVTWAVDDAAIATADGGSVTTTDPGHTTVRVLDTATGAVAAASLTVEWTLRRITLWPRQANRDVGDWERFTALGTFGRGGTAIVTDRLQYAVADPAVATLQSGEANPSEVVALQSGRTTISACDPLTSICSGDAGSAMLLVGGGLQSITVSPGATVSHFLGEHEQYTATGHFADGSSQDLTPIVTWSVSNPSVARASNTDGTRGRVYALTPGQTIVSATDPESGIVSTAWGNFVALGTLQGIYLDPPNYLQAGTSAALRAIGYYEGGDRDFSQAVTYEVDDAAVASTPNAPGDRARLHALTPGITTARARLTTPATTSNDVPVYVFGDITSMFLDLRGKPHTGIGGELTLTVHATFDSPGFFYSEALTFSGRPYQLVSDAPGVLEVVDGRTVRGVSGGIANLTAVDPATGTVSAPIAITVKGVLQSISLSPNGIVRAIGETQSFAANGHYVPALTGLLTQQLEYHSSDESVAIALNTPGNKSQVVMVGAGTAVISATDPVTGISSTDSGSDVTVTVRPGLLDRIVVSPPFVRRMFLDEEEFTAIGFYPDGTSINVTQQVEWISSDSSVAGAFGPPNRRSLFTAEGPGTAVIRAVHPQGVSSTDSGHDAVMEVDQVVSLHMTPAHRTVQPGWSTQFTLRATMASGADVNVTQQAFYFTTRPDIVTVPNVPPRKSETIAVAPGQATIQASFGFRGASATLTVVGGGSPSGAFLSP